MKRWMVALLVATRLGAEVARSQAGMVSTAHPLATAAGVAVLEAGGNAFDAAVAVAATLNVVEPENSGMGGFGLMLIYEARSGKVRVLNASGRIPKGAKREAYDDVNNRKGAKTTLPPVNVRAWEELSKNYGTQPWKTLFRAAIRHAEEGFVLARAIPESAFAEFPEHAKRIYGRNGKPLAAGERLVQRELGQSLRLVADGGAEVLHGGELGRKVAEELARAGSFVTFADIVASRAEWGEPIAIEYRGKRVMTAAPPTNSFAALVRLGIVSQWDMKGTGASSADYWHRWAEALKHGEYCRLRYAADPDVASVPLAKLLSVEYWQEQAARVDMRKASVFAAPGWRQGESENTTHFAVADRAGNVVTMTQTIGNTFGAKVMAPGTGIWLNDSLYYSTFEPRGNPMDVHPGRRKLNSNTPTIVMEGNRPWLAVGAAGGHTIPQTVPQVVAGMIDQGWDIEQALAAPRVAFIAETKVLAVEPGLHAGVRGELERRGHKLEVRDIGRLHGLTVEWGADGKPAWFTGAADPRGVGQARGPR